MLGPQIIKKVLLLLVCVVVERALDYLAKTDLDTYYPTASERYRFFYCICQKIVLLMFLLLVSFISCKKKKIDQEQQEILRAKAYSQYVRIQLQESLPTIGKQTSKGHLPDKKSQAEKGRWLPFVARVIQPEIYQQYISNRRKLLIE